MAVQLVSAPVIFLPVNKLILVAVAVAILIALSSTHFPSDIFNKSVFG